MIKDFLLFLGLLMAPVLILVFALAFGIGVSAAYLIDKPACAAETRDMNIAHRWSLMGGCQVQDAKIGWVPLDNYRVAR